MRHARDAEVKIRVSSFTVLERVPFVLFEDTATFSVSTSSLFTAGSSSAGIALRTEVHSIESDEFPE